MEGTENLYNICAITAKLLQETFWDKQKPNGLQYMLRRGVTKNVLHSFQIGYAADWYAKKLMAMGFKREDLIRSGAFRENDKEFPSIRFYGRVIFPIRDINGRVISFGGRAIDGEQGAKYINGPETEIFRKREILYGAEYAIHSKAKANGQPAILCEGYMDVIAMQSAGFRSTMASLGTALSKENAEFLVHNFSSVILLYDTDLPGRIATERAGKILRDVGANVLVANTGICKDPDELLKTGGTFALKETLAKSVPFGEWRLWNAVKENDRKNILDILLSGESSKETLYKIIRQNGIGNLL